MSPISNASRLADFGSGIGTAGAVLQVDNLNKRAVTNCKLQAASLPLP